jgi:simple sugar transport system permease protein
MMNWLGTAEAVAAASIRMAVPLVFAAEGEVLAERAGVLNVGLEGLMLVGAFAGAAAAHAAGSPWVGLLAGVLAGMALAGAFGAAAVYARANQVVAGLAVNLLAVGMTGVLYHAAAERASGGTAVAAAGGGRGGATFHDFAVPGLAAMPVLGPALFQRNALVYLSFAVVPLLAFFLYRTRAGLRLRATGEHPLAAAAAGADVARVRLGATVIGGGLAAAGGVYRAIGHLDRFAENMVAGRGFMALAIVILGRWNPWGALAAALCFGLAQGAQLLVGTSGAGVPYPLVLALPYAVTLAALCFRFGAARPPASLAVS